MEEYEPCAYCSENLAVIAELRKIINQLALKIEQLYYGANQKER